MTGEGKEIAVQIGHINSHMGYALGSVHHADGTDTMGFLHNRLDVIFEAQHIGHLRYGNDFRALRNLRFDILCGQIAVFFEINVFERCSFGFGHHLPGHAVAMMFRNRNHDFVPSIDIVQAIAIRHEVQRLCSVLGEDDFLRALGFDKLGRAFPRTLVNIRGLDGQGIGAAMRVGIAAAIVAADSLNHLFRLLGGGAIVEIRHLAAIDFMIQ